MANINIGREPTNAELLANWRGGVQRFPLVLLWLLLEAGSNDSAWAYFALEHLLPIYFVAALATFWRECAAFVLSLILALWSGSRAFWTAARAEFRIGLP